MIKFTLMGCGNSAGTPTIENYWGVCDPTEPKNRRLRPAGLVRSETTTLLIDAGPDLREQANRAGVMNPDAVIFTHAHADHVNGLEELRVFRQRYRKLVPIYGSQITITELHERFNYLFTERRDIYPAVVDPYVIEPSQMGKPLTIGDITFVPFVQDHGTCETLGFRFGDMAYSTDMININTQSLESLSGVKTWIVDAAAYNMEHNQVHANLKKVYELNTVVDAEQVYLTHLPHTMDYQTLVKELPPGYSPAYDGLELVIG